MIHPTAIVESGARLGAGCQVLAHGLVTRHCEFADGVVVHPFAVIGGDPQYLKFDPKLETGVRVGAGTVLREHVTINRSIKAGEFTTVGARCFLMAGSHVAHDCALGDDVVLANGVLLGGHVSVGSRAFVGGGAGVHQFCRIGESVMVSGNASLSRDVPPFVMVAERDDVIGLNVVGLKRLGVPRASIAEIKVAYQAVYFTSGNIREVAARSLASGAFETAEARRFLEFFAGGSRSFARARRSARAGTEE
jgi:UDP-N-acetylglucosamine acyltransferase